MSLLLFVPALWTAGVVVCFSDIALNVWRKGSWRKGGLNGYDIGLVLMLGALVVMVGALTFVLVIAAVLGLFV